MKQSSSVFFKQVLAEVKALPLTDIIANYTEVKLSAKSDNDALCPFHGDDNFGNFKINDRKNLYKCFSCDEYGDSIKFVMSMDELGFKEAVVKIACVHNLISQEQGEGILGGVVTSHALKKVEKRQKTDSEVIVEKGNSALLNKGFRGLMDLSSLAPNHRETLQARGLSDEEIASAEFFSFPAASVEIFHGLHAHLTEQGHSSQLLKQVPGFLTAEHLKQVQDKETRYLYVYANQNGMGIPVKNARGEVVGVQVRKDTVKEGEQRYSWFTSSYADGKNPFKHGTAAGAPIHVTYPKTNRFQNVAFITEGIFKANALAKTFESTALSLQGVGNYHDITTELSEIEKQNGKLEHIFVAFDADMAQNVHVYRHLKKMVELIQTAFPEVTIYNSLWNEEHGKGIDDLIQAGKTHELKRVNVQDFIAKYDHIIEELETRHEKKIVKVEKKFIKEAFEAQVFAPLISA